MLLMLVLEAVLAVVIGAAVLWLSVLPRARAKREPSQTSQD
ncbi:MAG: hypothetical protein ACRD2C_06225 [Acidimicrobiales bacterium]